MVKLDLHIHTKHSGGLILACQLHWKCNHFRSRSLCYLTADVSLPVSRRWMCWSFCSTVALRMLSWFSCSCMLLSSCCRCCLIGSVSCCVWLQHSRCRAQMSVLYGSRMWCCVLWQKQSDNSEENNAYIVGQNNETGSIMAWFLLRLYDSLDIHDWQGLLKLSQP